MNTQPPKRDEYEITRRGKNTLIVHSPVMPAAGTFGFGEPYRDQINIEKLGAIVTNPITFEPWSPASGTRIVPLDAGILVHTGLPNPGLKKTVKNNRNLWTLLPVPIIVHLVATTTDHIRRGIEQLEEEDCVDAVELGLPDDITWNDAETLVKAATAKAEKPIIVRLPVQDAYEIAEAVADAGADALVVCAPPRGTAREPLTGRLVSGRIYGPLVKPMILHMVGKLARKIDDVPIIGAGGIHTLQDARDYIDAGAVAVQVDTVTWVDPKILEYIARDLGGLVITREAGALPDEWHEGMGDTEKKIRESAKKSSGDAS